MTAINSNRAIRGPVTAVPVVAGKGVRLVADTDNNRWVVEADETVLFDAVSNNGDNSQTITLSENYTNFDNLILYYRTNDSDFGSVNILPITDSKWDLVTAANFSTDTTTNDGTNILKAVRLWLRNGNQLTKSIRGWLLEGISTSTVEGHSAFYILKVVGVNRIASN